MLNLWKPTVGGVDADYKPFDDFERVFRDLGRQMTGWSTAAVTPAADITETESAIQVTLDMPGHDQKDIQVKVENDVLTVRSERRKEQTEKKENFHRSERHYGVFGRSFVLPQTVDAQKIEARYEAGVLTVTLPKREEVKPKSIEVKVK